MGDQEILNVQQRVAALERKVAELYERLGQAEPEYGFSDDGFGSNSGPESDQQLIELVQSGKEIQAVKRYRELTGLGLAEAMDAVRVLQREYGPLDDQQY